MVAKRLVYPESEKYNKYDLESPLRPFPNQVGGHAALFQLNKNFVCKPMNEAESDFYSKQMPLELKDKWTANFCCEIELKPNDFTKTYDLCILNPSCSTTQNKQQLVEVCPNDEEQQEFEFLDVFSGIPTEANPWALECQLRRKKSDHSLNRFMVLENLCRNYVMPNILDIKLGVRQYSDNATDEKKKSQSKKCSMSTSKNLGIRLCGLQYFDEKLQVFQCLDKYFGRSLSEKQLYSMLSHFFQSSSNENIRSTDCLILIEQIESIKKVIEFTPGLRLFGVSLLIILEGKTDISNPKPPIARLIDFAHATFQSDNEPDHGCLMGLNNLSLTMKNILNE